MSADGITRIPDLVLEQYRLNELPAADAEHVTRRLRADAQLRARLATLEQSDEAISNAYPAGWLAQRARARASSGEVAGRPGRLRWLTLMSAFAALVLAVLVPLAMHPNDQHAEDRIKGLLPALSVYRRTPQGSEKLADGAVARAGDLLRLGYTAAGEGYGVIVSIDGRGIVTRHLPVDGGRAVSLRSDGTVLLDAAYELDDAPSVERIYFITATEPFDVAPVLDAARRAASAAPRLPVSLSLPRSFAQSTFSLQKEAKP